MPRSCAVASKSVFKSRFELENRCCKFEAVVGLDALDSYTDTLEKSNSLAEEIGG